MSSRRKRRCARCAARTRSITTTVSRHGGSSRRGRRKMSKFLKDYMLPAGGGIALILGISYGLANQGYGDSEIALLEDRNAQVAAQVAELSEQIAAAQQTAATSEDRVSALESALEEARAEAARA